MMVGGSESQGYKQHLSYAKIRSIETRRSIARSANTGSSAIINKKGEIVNQLDYNTKGIINGKINLSDELTFYVKYGDFIYRFSLFFFLIIYIILFHKEKKILIYCIKYCMIRIKNYFCKY